MISPFVYPGLSQLGTFQMLLNSSSLSYGIRTQKGTKLGEIELADYSFSRCPSFPHVAFATQPFGSTSRG